jgi:hypothetical protein
MTGPVQATGLLGNAIDLLDGDRLGWLYYGANGADRGLGYRGSYMTLGGFIPYAEDDLGGLWAADLRSHLSVYGGFFSNVGMVRKQFIGGTLLGVGVYWDYDGDQNQYADTTITDISGSYVFSGGETYQQVGISGEWLTDWGNLRSNGYIPAGETATTMGPFVGNSILARNGINAALGGADLEVGAYVPALSDWAGMVSVGGYTYGNTLYGFPNGNVVVPFFGGVYTRLDMTFARNWDFSLQANNDSFFDWTGFARLTYRLGSSRRRNVPDQVEQPMMRNEHIVRAHQAPVQAINPFTRAPWFVTHVSNLPKTLPGGDFTTASTLPGNGTFARPFQTLTEGQAAAGNPYDIVYVHQGISYRQPYLTPNAGFTFSADNQILAGQGTRLRIPTVAYGPILLSDVRYPNQYPTISNPEGTAVVLTDAVSTSPTAGTVSGARMDHLRILGSPVGISDGAGLPVDGVATVNDVRIIGNGASQRGVEITAPRGDGRSTINLRNMVLNNRSADGIYVRPDDASTAELRVNVSDSRILRTNGSGVWAQNLAGEARVRIENVTIEETSNSAVTADDAQVTLYRSVIRNTGIAGVDATDTSVVQIARSRFEDVDIGVLGSARTGDLNITINDNQFLPTRIGTSIMLSGRNVDLIDVSKVFANVNGNRFVSTPTGPQDILLFDAVGALTPAAAESSTLNIKAASIENLRAINNNGTVINVFPNDPTPSVPPPPNYDPSLRVVLPPF